MSIKLTQSLFVGVCLVSSSWAFAAVKEYHLNIDEQMINVNKPLKRITVNGQFPAPLLEFEEGDDAIIHVHNKLKHKRFFHSLAWFIAARFNGWRAGLQPVQGY